MVYNANGGENGVGDRAYGPCDRQDAENIADYMNTFTQEWGRAWALPLTPASEAPRWT